jgi:Kef-type K+ transport system membrane component KefB
MRALELAVPSCISGLGRDRSILRIGPRMTSRFKRFLGCALALSWASPALATSPPSYPDPLPALLLALGVILLGAKLGGDLAVRLRQPAVLGELVFGVVLGNLAWLGYDGAAFIASDPNIDMLARLGVIMLLFEVGLESTVGQMLEVGLPSLVVATIGVVTPCILGYAVSALLLPAASLYVHCFLGATLCATSVGITARVLKDLKRSQTEEARIILGAAVIDDVMGLVVLAVVSGSIAAADSGGSLSPLRVASIVLKALAFLGGSLLVGVHVTPRVFTFASKLRAADVLLAVGLCFCFGLAWLASALELAPIVGAFAAGLILEAVHYRDFTERGEHGLEGLVKPLAAFLVPVFFVLMGMRTDLRSFAQPGTLVLALALTAAAILGKQLCYFGVPRAGLDRLSIGIGMIPRGEVGLIFASMGASLSLGGKPLLEPAQYSAIVIMVIATTLATPPALKWSLARWNAKLMAAPKPADSPPAP